MSDRISLADRAVIVLSEIKRLEEGVESDNPHRYTFYRLKAAAERAVEHGLMQAGEIIEAARALRNEIESISARNDSITREAK